MVLVFTEKLLELAARCNGTQCLTWVMFQRLNQMRLIIQFIYFDNSKTTQSSLIHDVVKIEQMKHSLHVHGRSIIRYQFQLIPCWAWTVHKVRKCQNPYGIQSCAVTDWRFSEHRFICNCFAWSWDHLKIILFFKQWISKQNRSYRNSETKRNVEAQKRKQRGGNDRKRRVKTKNKQERKQLISSLQPVRLEWLYQEHESSIRHSL